jgi:hypothetical protein
MPLDLVASVGVLLGSGSTQGQSASPMLCQYLSSWWLTKCGACSRCCGQSAGRKCAEIKVLVQKMLKTSSTATRQASTISSEDLETVLMALRCVVIPQADDEKDDLADTSEFAWQDNKYKPQQQEQYLTILKSEVSGPI